MTHRHPLFASRMDPECYQKIRTFAAKHPETTLRDIMEAAVEQYLRSHGEWVDAPVDTEQVIRLRGGRRRKVDLLDDAVVILDDEEVRDSA